MGDKSPKSTRKLDRQKEDKKKETKQKKQAIENAKRVVPAKK